jgi:hypothetical protein
MPFQSENKSNTIIMGNIQFGLQGQTIRDKLNLLSLYPPGKDDHCRLILVFSVVENY